jgi:predicted enzyme related to lactoylglutathione lyase
MMDKVVHFEIPADNLDRAKKFYQSLFGWQITDIPEMNYTIVNTVPVDENNMPKEPGAINGGMLKRNHAGEQPVIVINVSSVDEYLKKVEKAGGKTVMPKVQVGEMGLYARVTDTEGNVIGLWEHLRK